jgi:hypothetical protein
VSSYHNREFENTTCFWENDLLWEYFMARGMWGDMVLHVGNQKCYISAWHILRGDNERR